MHLYQTRPYPAGFFVVLNRPANSYIYTWTPGYCPYVSFKDLFITDDCGSEHRYVYPGTPEYSRIMVERRDAEKKTGLTAGGNEIGT